ncbi:hypothetical protein PHET_02987 [Paragonimus heterotremus]|uniref:TGF-beta family profile domain-containing protein n=1 Tax=Paragonimus heterotremus TaxID=100268 RepID=A0A8J4SRM1_9TREM|nr:hypothetical protein PHET_02987 [Paragonimus heterotremus]
MFLQTKTNAKELYMTFLFASIIVVLYAVRTQAGESTESESGQTDHIVQDSLLVQLLTALRDEPKTLSLEEVNALRRSTPVAVERYVRLMNNPGLLEDLSLNRISKNTFEDLQKSVSFLEIGQCRTSESELTQTCLVIRRRINFPRNNPVVFSRLSTLLVPWIDPTKLALTAYSVDSPEKQSEQIFQLDNSSHLFGTYVASRMHKQEVRWDVTELIMDLQRHRNASSFPLILKVNCLDHDCRFSPDSWRLYTHPAFSVYNPRDNTHNLLLNQYFTGLNDKEREILYNSMPCCAANETSPFTIVYKTRDNVLVTDTLQKAVKMSCACG